MAPRHRLERATAPVLLFLLGLAVYWTGMALHNGAAFPQSPWPYFVYYARALLDGQLSFSVPPPATLDLAFHEGRLYMHQPPFPAVLLAPFVAVAGLGVSDRFLCVLLGAANGAAFHTLLRSVDRRGLLPIPEPARVALSVFFLFGTVHFYLAMTGNPWELAHVVCNGLLILALLAAVERRYALCAVLYVAILFTRTHVFLSLPVVLALYWLREAGDRPAPRDRVRGLAPLLSVSAVGVAALLAFNAARFGDPFENGASHHAMHETFRARFERTGYFDLAYLPRNLRALLWLGPETTPRFPWLRPSGEGLSVFLASPLYLYLLRSLRAPTRRTAAVLWVALALPLVPILLLMGTGELQFGHRYSSDLQVFAIGLTWLGMGLRLSRPALALLALSVAVNAAGAAWFLASYAR